MSTSAFRLPPPALITAAMTRYLILALAILSSAASGGQAILPVQLEVVDGTGKIARPPLSHFILTTEHTLRPEERAALEAAGVEIQSVLPEGRYIVRTADADDLAANPLTRSLETIPASTKIARSAMREAARGRAFARVRLVFHEDVSFADAQQAIERVGGLVDDVFAGDYVLPQRLHARVPFGSIASLAKDDSVFAIFGPPLHLKRTNASAALLSNVTPLHTLPYGLTGSGVTLSLFELASADSNHPEFGGRLTPHVIGGGPADRAHATHVSGTIAAAGLNGSARGMAPAARLHEFDARPDYEIVLRNKETQLPPLGVVADNNSWGFALGWQSFPGAPSNQAWYGGDDLFGGYEAFYSSPYDKITRTSGTLFVQSSGNEGSSGNPSFSGINSPHGHVSETTGALLSGTYCYSLNGSGTDCPSPCSTGSGFCETTKHPTYGPFDTLGPTGSLKNVIAVGAVDPSRSIASFSSRGPTDDGRVKPDLVAKGTSIFSTVTGAGYTTASGTSMSTPVVTGIAALIVEQWRRTFAGQNPLPVVVKTLLTAGADDLGAPGPDYTFGFGLVNARASVDLILADRGVGSRVRVAAVTQGQTVEVPLTVFGSQKVRVVVGWNDPEVVLRPDEFASKTLVNDLDVKIIDPSGVATMPYVLDKANPNAAATRGVNTVDNIEQVEIANAGPGTYRIVITGTNVAVGPSQQYVLTANSILGALEVACDDPLEPNDSEAAAYGFLLSGQPISGVTCSPSDLDFYRVRSTVAGNVVISVTATDTPLRLTVAGNVRDIAAGTTGSVTVIAGAAAQVHIVRVEANGPLGSSRKYTVTATFPSAGTPRRRSAR